MLEGNGSGQRLQHEDFLLFYAPNPVRKFCHVGHRGREHDKIDMGGEHDDHFLPDHTSLLVRDVMHLVKHHPLNIAQQRRILVQHRPENLRGHDKARILRSNLDVPGDDTHPKLLPKVAILLIADGFNGRGINCFAAILLR